jgi:hypothetical protein
VVADSPIVLFYKGIGTDHRGRSLRELQIQNLQDLEIVHDYIQWLFPLAEASSANQYAPVLQQRDIEIFKRSPELRQRLLESLETMLRFYGLELVVNSDSLTVARAPSFSTRQGQWLRPFNHNYLRITRILRSLTVLGEAQYARSLLHCLEQLYAETDQVIGAESMAYWRGAVE